MDDRGGGEITEQMADHIPALRRYARALVHSIADADDLVQDCLLRAIAKRDHFEPGSNLRAWMMAILHNCFIDGFRKKRRHQEVGDTQETLSRGLYTPENQTQVIQLNDVAKAISQLPSAQRSTLLLASLEDLSYEQIAEITNVPVGTVRSRLSRARHTVMRLVNDGPAPDRGTEILPEFGTTDQA